MSNFRKICAFLLFHCLGGLLKPNQVLFSQEKLYELSICAIFKNEAEYLKEWIEFHKLQGVEHFYLYNNNSDDDYFAILRPYIETHEVTLIQWPYRFAPGSADAEEWLAIQSGSYTDCIQRYGVDTQWIAFIDIDEFLFCPKGQLLPIFLRQYKQYGGLGVNWLLFGTSNLESIPSNTLMIENLIRCAPQTHFRNYRVKSIVQPQFTKSAENAHVFFYKKGYFAVTADKKILGSNIFSRKLSIDQIRINHYWTRTERYFAENKLQSHANRRVGITLEGMREVAKTYNTCTDAAILQFVPKLKEKMGYGNH